MKSPAALLAFLVSAAAVSATGLRLDNGVAIPFGAALAPLAKELDEPSFDVADGRAGIDRQLATHAAELRFDSDKLWCVIFKFGHRFIHPLTAFTDTWKNFDPLEGRKISAFMANDDFMAYFQAWTERARAAGKRENVDFWVKHETSAQLGDTLTITFAPRRRLAGTGDVTGDQWVFRFVGEVDHRYRTDWRIGALKEVVATSDAFSTHLRTPEGAAPAADAATRAEPARGGVVLDDGTPLYFGQAKAEVERLLGASAGEVLHLGAREGVDQQIELRAVTVYFDTGRLSVIRFTRTPEKLTPFPEPWKNFALAGEHRLKPGMSPEEFMAYLAAWEQRAAAAGKTRRAEILVQEFKTPQAHSILVWMQPSRVGTGGRVTPDLWRIMFTPIGTATERTWRLFAIEAGRGEFNTRTRSPLEENFIELTHGAPRLEPPKIELAKPTVP